MKLVSLCAIFCWFSLNAFSQVDTTKKPIDTIPAKMDSVSLTDTLKLHAITDSPANVAVQLAPEPVTRGSHEVYKIKPGIDWPLTLVGTAVSLYGFQQIYNKTPSSEAQISSLRKSDINGFDRWAADVYNANAANISDVPFYAAMPLPLVLMIADKDIRKDAGKYLFLYWETMAVTGVFYTGAPMLWDRYRPLAYNENAPMSDRTSGVAKNSFFAGHVALVASSTFFLAKTYADYHPDSKIKWVFYTGASAATAFTAYLRHAGGKHFPSDILVGTAIGTASGILVPHFHKHRLIKNPNISIHPFTGRTTGVYAVYRFK